MLLIVTLTLLASCRQEYETSIFGHPGVDDVVIDYVDGFSILERNLPKKPTKPIRELNLTTYIPEDTYPWPGHKLTCDWQTLLKETKQIRTLYNSDQVSEDMNYKHPVAAKQFRTTDEALDSAERVKVKVTLSPKYSRHFSQTFIPPGEIISIDIKESAKGKVKLFYNKYMSNIWTLNNGKPKFDQRIDQMHIYDLVLNHEHNTVGLPYGAVLTLVLVGNDPVELNITGVILCPYFKYGVHSDEDWEQNLSKRPGPVAIFDTGNLFMTTTSNFVRNAIRMNDNMKFWRSAYQTSQFAAKDNYNAQDKRPLNILEMNFETFVPAGAAVAFVGRNFIHYPPGWVNAVSNWENLQGVPWGIAHEMNHHHQGGWADGGGEMTNNVLNLLIFAKSNQAASTRTVNGGLKDWGRYTHPFQTLNNNEVYGLSLYSNFIHFFGVEKMTQYIRSDQKNTLYNRNDKLIGKRGAQVLRASKIFGRNMRYHFNFHQINDSVLCNFNPEESKVFKLLEELNLPDFHPVTNPYSCGYIVDGQRFETARPFHITSEKQIIDFVSTMRQRADKTKFGDFSFHGVEFEAGRESAWEEIEPGKYLMTPKSNFVDIEEVLVKYYDSTTGEITTMICKFKQIEEKYANYKRFSGIGHKNVFQAYDMSLTMKSVEDKRVNQIISPTFKQDSTGWVSVTTGIISPPETANYVFSLAADEQGLFYLSENPLAGNQIDDAQYLLNHQKSYNYNYNTVNHSKPICLEEGKKYYFSFVIYNSPGNANQGGGKLGFKVEGDNSFSDVPNSWLHVIDVNAKDVWDTQYVPEFDDIPELNKWTGITFERVDPSGWNITKWPRGEFIKNSNNGQGSGDNSRSVKEALTDGDSTTEWRTGWWRGNKPLPFPHVYEIDMNEKTMFKHIKIGGTGNRNWFDMDSTIEIRVSTEYSKLDDNSSIVYFGRYQASNPFIEPKYASVGRYMRITIFNNSKIWKDNNPGKSSISCIEVGTVFHANKVVPITNSNITIKGKTNITYDGLYYNGRGLILKKGSSVTFKFNNQSEIGVIGDIWPTMGKATVKLNHRIVGTISNTVMKEDDLRRLTLASRSYKQILFYRSIDRDFDNNITIEVTKGEIILSGFIIEENEKVINRDYVDSKNSILKEINEEEEIFEEQETSTKIEEIEQKTQHFTTKTIGIVGTIVCVSVISVGFIVIYKKSRNETEEDEDEEDIDPQTAV